MADRNDYIGDLKNDLAALEARMAEARRELESGRLRDRPDAAGDLAVLETRHEKLAQRLAEAERDDAADWSTLHAGLREQLDAIGDTIERLFGPSDRG